MDTSKSERQYELPALDAAPATSWIPVSGAAELLKVSRQRVYQLIQSGAIVARQVGRTWLVSHRSVESRIALLLAEGGK